VKYLCAALSVGARASLLGEPAALERSACGSSRSSWVS